MGTGGSATPTSFIFASFSVIFLSTLENRNGVFNALPLLLPIYVFRGLGRVCGHLAVKTAHGCGNKCQYMRVKMLVPPPQNKDV